nr:hypothetical protein [Tanacetum cinerariifolium]GEX31621.1 hypothetical protein [Tanacetum cinerariifolium]
LLFREIDNVSMLLKSCLKESMIQNIKGKTIGKDGKPQCALHKPVRVPSHEENLNLVGDAIHVRVPLVHEENPNLMRDMIVKDKMVQSDGVASKAGETGSDHQHGMNPMGTNSFASVLQAKPSKRVVKIMELRNEESVEREAVAVPFEAMEEEVKKALVWIKLHHIPIVGYSEVGLSLITTQLAIPVGKDKGHTLATIDIEYEWKPPWCSTCVIFDHTTNKCPKLPKEVPAVNDIDEGFVEVKKKKNKNKVHPQQQIDDEEGNEDEMYSDSMKEQEDVLNVSDSKVDEEILVDDQKGVFTSNVTELGGKHSCYRDEKERNFLFVYLCHNKYNQRRSLWRSLSKHKVYVSDRPWCILGDFNATLFLEDSTASGSTIDIAMRDFRDCVEDIEKAKIHWLKEGDSNSAYFHKAVKSRFSRSRIDAVTNVEGVVFENNMVPDAFVSHYETFLGLAGETRSFNGANLFKTCLNEQVASDMVRNVTTLEVNDALFSIGDDKSPGPDGYTAAFLKDAWDVVANDVKSPTRVNDYRPISCCNVLFKCISKIIANHIKHSLKSLICPNQSAFILGRSITNNILLTQELMHNYQLDRGTPRCAFKVDIQKAYDTVDWDCLRVILHGFGFHDQMISWIMECMSTTSYSICVNGLLHGYFQGKRRLRQGDLLSPYLFTLVMEVFTLMLQRKVQESNVFTYHMYCSKMELINLCFTDDLFLFAYGDVQSASIIKEALDEFKEASRLIPSLPKSMTYFCNVLNHIKLMRSFLWCHGNMGKGKSKVSWEVVCLPKDEGGLGIHRLECFNSALMTAHIWKLLTLKELLWVKWIHEYKLNGRNLAAWRCDLGPLASHISSRDMFRAGLNLKSKVKDVIHNGSWLWPHDLLVKYPFLSECHAPIIDDNPDCLE